MHRIVVATDFSADADRAIARAGRIAAECGATLELLHVAILQELRFARALPGLPADIKRRVEREVRNRLEKLRGLVPESVSVDTSIRFGFPKAEILKSSAAADLVVLGVRGTNPIRDLLLGTTAERILGKVRVPVLIVKRPSTEAYRRVLVPVDFSQHTQHVLAAAESIAPSAELTAMHAFVVPFEGHLRMAAVAEERIAGYRVQESAAARQQLDAALADRTTHRWQRTVVHGDATPAIVQLEEQLRADLIVMGKHGRSVLAETLIGSVARRTIAASQGDVLVVPSRSVVKQRAE